MGKCTHFVISFVLHKMNIWNPLSGVSIWRCSDWLILLFVSLLLVIKAPLTRTWKLLWHVDRGHKWLLYNTVPVMQYQWCLLFKYKYYFLESNWKDFWVHHKLHGWWYSHGKAIVCRFFLLFFFSFIKQAHIHPDILIIKLRTQTTRYKCRFYCNTNNCNTMR